MFYVLKCFYLVIRWIIQSETTTVDISDHREWIKRLCKRIDQSFTYWQSAYTTYIIVNQILKRHKTKIEVGIKVTVKYHF